jgi:hypothetical protein
MHVLDDLNTELPSPIWAEDTPRMFKKLAYCAGRSAKIFSLREQVTLRRAANTAQG